MSGFAASDEKKTDAVMDFSSSSMPALAAACLTMAWVFWRGALIEVWQTIFSFLSPLARMPSAPFFQPADSRIWLAFSTLNSARFALDAYFDGAFRKLGVVWPPRP